MGDRRYGLGRVVERLEPGTSVPRALGVSSKVLIDYAVLGLTERQAERLAVRLGVDPYQCWPEMLDEAIAEVERECAAVDCAVRFVPPAKAPHKRFCSSTCRRREQRREQYRRDPEFRERVRAQMRRYYAETRDYQVSRARKNRAQARRRAA